MDKKILLTSFEVWQPHQLTNSSDDLFIELLKTNSFHANVYMVRKLPVDFKLAPQQVISKIDELNSDAVICCGMAEKRNNLTIESNGKSQIETLNSPINLEYLVKDLTVTTISHDAGKFVCNHLYYSVLKYIQKQELTINCIFVHVPILNRENLPSIVSDFQQILKTFSLLE